MGHYKEELIENEDYKRLVLNTMFEMGAIEECIYCKTQYLTGKDEKQIYATVTNVFKAKYGENYDNLLMKKMIKEVLDESFYGHFCDEGK